MIRRNLTILTHKPKIQGSPLAKNHLFHRFKREYGVFIHRVGNRQTAASKGDLFIINYDTPHAFYGNKAAKYKPEE